MKLYLAGPIHGCTDEECRDWRQRVRVAVHPYWKAFDPMRHDYRGREVEMARRIVELDKEDIRKCDAVLVDYPGPSVGTSMEVLLAWQMGIPVYVVAHPDTPMSPWLTYHVTDIFHSLDDAITFLRRPA